MTNETGVKPGFKTTEFWLALLAQIVGVLAAGGIFGADSVVMRILGVVGIVLASMGYSGARGKAKQLGSSAN